MRIMTGVNLTTLVQNAHFFSGRLRVQFLECYGSTNNQEFFGDLLKIFLGHGCSKTIGYLPKHLRFKLLRPLDPITKALASM